MAQEELKIIVSADTAEAKKNLGEVNSKLENVNTTSEKSGGSFKKGLGSIKSVCATGVKAVAGVATGALALGGALIAVTESTREYRTAMGKLDTAFATAGLSSKTAKDTYTALNGVLGDTDVAVEASNHLAKLCKNEKDLQKWTNICTGVYATFGDSLPIEGLTEAANETAKVGQVTGPLADALNWAGVSEDKFNESLSKCSNESERQALITSTLTGLYDDASKKYQQNNKDLINANMAQDKLTSTMATFGAIVEPILTNVKIAFANLLITLAPAVQQIASVLLPLLSTAFSTLFSLLQTVWETVGKPIVDGILQMFTNVGTGGSGAFSIIQTAFETLVSVLQEIWSSVGEPIFNLMKEVIGLVASFIVENFDSIKLAFKTNIDIIKTIYNTIFKPVFDLIMSLVNKVVGVFKDNFSTISDIYKSVVSTISTQWNTNLKPVFEKIGSFITDVLKPIFDKVFTYGILPIIEGAFTTIKNLWEKSLKPIFEGICTFLNGVFTLNWKKIFNGLKSIVSGVFNGMLNILKAPFRAIANLWNKTIGKISFSLPDWIPVIGGKTFGFPKIPEFAKGGVVENDTLARIGEAGREAVVPLENNTEWTGEVARLLGGAIGTNNQPLNITLKVGETTFGKIAIDSITKLTQQQNYTFNLA